MRIATLLFTYNRGYHTEQVIQGLKNSMAPIQKLFVFQDGLKEGMDDTEWRKVNKLIQNIDWYDKEIIVSDYNKGLAKSIVSGIDYAFKEYDAVIVLEDDCVPTVNFISFMEQCFEKYRDNKRVYSVSGYAWPIELPKEEHDIYGCGRISSWGWGTWKDRWEQRSIDSGFIERIKNDQDKSRWLAMWGNDCEQMLLNRIAGNNDSWAIYWGLYIIENNGICINPYESLIQNIGMDGSGAHCGISERYEVKLSGRACSEFKLPEHIDILHTTEVAFADFLGSHTATNRDVESKEHVLIYGMGNFFFQNEKEINKSCYIKAFIDNYKKGWYAGKRIIHLNQLAEYSFSRIIIMVQDIQQCIDIIKELISRGVCAQKIILGHSCYGAYKKAIDKIMVESDGSLLLGFHNNLIIVKTGNEFRHACDIFLNRIWEYHINNQMKDIVFDIGAGIGDSTVYFADLDSVKKVYCFESSADKFAVAEKNLKEYLRKGKVEIFNYDIGNKDAISKGQASEVFQTINEEYLRCNIILKINCEAKSDDILQELLENKLLEKFKLIILEKFHRENSIYLDYLEAGGFSWWCNTGSENMGVAYAYKN